MHCQVAACEEQIIEEEAQKDISCQRRHSWRLHRQLPALIDCIKEEQGQHIEQCFLPPAEHVPILEITLLYRACAMLQHCMHACVRLIFDSLLAQCVLLLFATGAAWRVAHSPRLLLLQQQCTAIRNALMMNCSRAQIVSDLSQTYLDASQ